MQVLQFMILQEEKYLSNFEQYRKYKSLVTNRYIPNLFNIFNIPIKLNLNLR